MMSGDNGDDETISFNVSSHASAATLDNTSINPTHADRDSPRDGASRITVKTDAEMPSLKLDEPSGIGQDEASGIVTTGMIPHTDPSARVHTKLDPVDLVHLNNPSVEAESNEAITMEPDQMELIENIYIFLRRTLGCCTDFSVGHAQELLDAPDTSAEQLLHAHKIRQHAHTCSVALAKQAIWTVRSVPTAAYLKILLPLVQKLLIVMQDLQGLAYKPTPNELDVHYCTSQLVHLVQSAEANFALTAQQHECGSQEAATFGLAFSGGGVRASAQVTFCVCVAAGSGTFHPCNSSTLFVAGDWGSGVACGGERFKPSRLRQFCFWR